MRVVLFELLAFGNRNVVNDVVLDEGQRYKILRPFAAKHITLSVIPLLAPPETWIQHLITTHEYLKTVTTGPDDNLPLLSRAQNAYLELLEGFLTGVSYYNAEKSVSPALKTKQNAYENLKLNYREIGMDWAFLGMTMIGKKRIDNIKFCLTECFKNNVKGGYMETGVWRGGASIYARGVIRAYNQSDRISFVCDSFQGLPPSVLVNDPTKWDETKYLEVRMNTVIENFSKLGLSDRKIVFAKGFFNETMKPLAKHMHHPLAVLRLDGDMYQSTVDVLYHMYDKVSLGGYVIIDDWIIEETRTACQDFFRVHGIKPAITNIDNTSSYFKKDVGITVQYWRYEKRQFT